MVSVEIDDTERRRLIAVALGSDDMGQVADAMDRLHWEASHGDS